jgi:pathogenesis-related protein 1
MSINQQQILARINRVRQQHGAGPVTWDTGLARMAQDWANRKVFSHSTDRQHGENLAKVWAFEPDFATAIDIWAKELDLYDYDHPGFNNSTGHGTALVWLKTTKIGAGVAKMDNGAYLYVLKLFPPGNVNDVNAFRQNVIRR